MTTYRSFGRTKGKNPQQYVCDKLETLSLDSKVVAPDLDGIMRRFAVARLGVPFEREGETMVYAYLTLVSGAGSRSFGQNKSSGEHYVRDKADLISEGMLVMAPEADGTKRRRTIVRLGTPFQVGEETMVYGYLSTDFTSGPELKSEGWTPKQIAMLGAPDATRKNPVRVHGQPTKLWHSDTIKAVQRTKAWRNLEHTPEQLQKARATSKKATATKAARDEAALRAPGDERT